jgi:maltooligosyltrehalose trehalohydrolase
MGSGSSLPEKLIREQEVKIHPQSFAVYELETLAE